MGIFDAYRQKRRTLTAPESVATLSHMEGFFQGGANWKQGEYHAANGTKCLVGAADHVRVSSIDDAKHWLRQAIAEQTAGAITTIEGFNDSRQSFAEIAAVIDRAKQLATTARLPAPVTLRALPAPAYAQPLRQGRPEIIPPVRAALPSPARTAPVVIDAMPQARDLSRRSGAQTDTVRAQRRSLIDWVD
jgi:hypothetical protein